MPYNVKTSKTINLIKKKMTPKVCFSPFILWSSQRLCSPFVRAGHVLWQSDTKSQGHHHPPGVEKGNSQTIYLERTRQPLSVRPNLELFQALWKRLRDGADRRRMWPAPTKGVLSRFLKIITGTVHKMQFILTFEPSRYVQRKTSYCQLCIVWMRVKWRTHWFSVTILCL